MIDLVNGHGGAVHFRDVYEFKVLSGFHVFHPFGIPMLLRSFGKGSENRWRQSRKHNLHKIQAQISAFRHFYLHYCIQYGPQFSRLAHPVRPAQDRIKESDHEEDAGQAETRPGYR